VVDERHAKIESMMTLSPDVVTKIADRLKKKYGNDLTTDFTVDPTLLGGLRVRPLGVWMGAASINGPPTLTRAVAPLST